MNINEEKLPLWFIKWYRYEFWPYWFFYFPMLFYGLILAIKNASLTYYTKVNPAMTAGGVAGEGKLKMLSRLSVQFLPTTTLINSSFSSDLIEISMIEAGIDFPCVVKPNGSERGIGVEIMNKHSELLEYLQLREGEFLIQELVDLQLEFGVLYHRYSDGRSGITSVVKKEFLSVTGNGKDDLQTLISANTRARFNLDYLNNKFSSKLTSIPAVGERILLEPIGNHNRGTSFLDARELISDQLISVFDEIARPLEGFNYGRFDLKVSSEEDLKNGVNIRILEINGVESEPAHIYDPGSNLVKAYRSVIQHMNLISNISAQNKKQGIRGLSFLNFIFVVRQHFKQRSGYAVS